MVCETSLIIVTPYQCCLIGESFWYSIRLEQHKVGRPVGIKYILLIMVCETNLLTAILCQCTCKVKLFWYLISLEHHKATSVGTPWGSNIYHYYTVRLVC